MRSKVLKQQENDSSDEMEKRFKEFTDRLLNAEQYAFTERERDVFTPGRLQMILQQFCEIIAEHVDAQSCTIQLKIYDSAESVRVNNHQLSVDGKKVLERFNNEHGYLEMMKIRESNISGSLSFPYRIYPKHAVKLMASNKASPWYPFVNGSMVTSLMSGLTANINQDRTAKLRDPLDIRATRNMRKLGTFDAQVWTGANPALIFYNYYGVPIRIHSGGEAVGILKVENKGLFPSECLLRLEDLLTPQNYSIVDRLRSGSKFADAIMQHLSLASRDALNNRTIRESGFVVELNGILHRFRIANHAKNGWRLVEIGEKQEREMENYQYIVHNNVQLLFKALKVSLPKRFKDSRPCCHRDRCARQRRLYNIWNSTDIRKSIIETSGLRRSTRAVSEGTLRRSLLNLAFLNADLKETSGDWIRLEYPVIAARVEKKKRVLTLGEFWEFFKSRDKEYRALIPKNDRRPPLQILFKSVAAELAFLKEVLEFATTSESTLFKQVEQFYNLFHEKADEIIREGGEVTSALKKALERCLKKKHDFNVEVSSKDTPRFCYRFYTKGSSALHEAFILCLPTVAEMHTDQGERWGFNEERWKSLLALNAWYVGDPLGADFEKETLEFQGELVNLHRDHIVPDDSRRNLLEFVTERLAARRQALAFASELPNFGVADAMKLSWAAVEIGKLIERQVSYRGNHLEPAVPLTAVEFARLPISSLSFVDDLRSQYLEAEGVRDRLQYYLRNEVHHLGFVRSVNLSTRIKPWRSYLERLGERHPRLENAIVILWLYLLGLLDRRGNLRKSVPDLMEFGACLYQFTKMLERLWRLSKKAHFIPLADRGAIADIRKYFPHCAHDVSGDLTFHAPLLEVENELTTLKHARDNVLLNLIDEGLFPKDVRPKTEKYQKACEHLLYRHYDPYVCASISLLIQLDNRLEQNDAANYCAFYTGCRAVKEWLIDADGKLQELQDSKLLKEFDEIVRTLREFLLGQGTKTFAKLLNSEDKSAFLLNEKGLYKRARMILNVHRHQRPPKELGWELGKLDYVGARLDCLFRNQVFAAYESIWERADPFFNCAFAQNRSRQNFVKCDFDMRLRYNAAPEDARAAHYLIPGRSLSCDADHGSHGFLGCETRSLENRSVQSL
jgi:hypothetical protein